MKKTIRKSLSILLSLLMMLSVLPLSAFAETPADAASDQISGETQAVEEAPDDAQPHQGQLLSAVITVGKTKSTYARNDAGKLKLVSEETLGRRGPLKAPAKMQNSWFNVEPAALKEAAQWALSAALCTPKAVADKDGNLLAVYGIAGYDALHDSNYDLICDDCGYCLNGCSDGVTRPYTDKDIATGPDIDGKYYNAENVWIGTDAKGEYTYEQVDDAGNVIYEDDGVTPKTTTVEYTYIQFETYTTDVDGVCDVCGKNICMSADGLYGHSYADGFCDVCQSCMASHTDVTGATQESGDGVCDVCEKEVHTFIDENEDEVCDICGKDAQHTCVDETGNTTEIADGICDVCGYCTGACKDENADALCDVCGKQYAAGCSHSDLFGKDACNQCATTCRHATIGRLQQLMSVLQQIQAALLAWKDAGTEIDEAFLNDTLTPVLTDKAAGGSETSLASVISMRNEFSTVKAAEDRFTNFCDAVSALTAQDVTAAELIGTVRSQDGETVLDRTGSYAEQVETQLAQYEDAYDSVVYEQTKAYFKQYANRAQKTAACTAKLDTLAGALFDAQLTALYGSSTPKKFDVTAENRGTVRANMRLLDEALLYHLYGAAWRTESVDAKAAAVWSSYATPTYTDDAERRAVGYALIDQIQFDVNALKEAAFTGFEQTTYDEQGYYTKREATEDDILRDPDKDADDYIVTDATIQSLISVIDGFLGSPEALSIIQKFLPESLAVSVTDCNNDGVNTIYDFLICFLMQKVVSDDLINSLFSLIFPTVTSLINSLPELLTDNQYVSYMGDGRYQIDIINALLISDGMSESSARTINDILDAISIGGNLTFYVNGGRAKSLKDLLSGAGFSFWPSQIATLLSQADSSQYADIISALRGCGDDWTRLLTNEKLNFTWNVRTMDDLKEILSVIFGAVAPMLEMLFASKITQYKEIKLNQAVYFSVLISLLIINIPLASDGSMNFYPDEFNMYQDVVAPIFEALGVNSFAPADGSSVPTYQFRDITFTSVNTAQNTRKVVDGLLDPLQILLQQFASHPLEKLLSILPNLALMLENGGLLDLFDLKSAFSLFISTSFNLNSASDFFSGLGDIIENQIMKHWYDWLNPVKYLQLITTTIAYAALQPVVGSLFSFLSIIDMGMLTRLGIVNLSDTVDDLVSENVFPLLPDAFNHLASLFGGKMKAGATDFDWPKNVSISTSNLIGNLNLGELIESYLTSGNAVRALGFDLNKLSTVLKWFFKNLVDEHGQIIHLFDLSLLDLDTLSSLGKLEKRSGSIREDQYKRRWNTLRKGEYYFVKADTSDVFYYCLKLISGVLSDKKALETILSMIGLDYDELKTALAELASDGENALRFPLNALLNDACDEDGKLDLDLLRAHLTADNLLAVMCESLVPQNAYPTDELTYPKAPATTAEEVAAHDGAIPYLEYDNRWTKALASFATEDLDDVADALLKELPLDLNKDTEQIETLREFAKPLILKYLNDPSYITLVVELLCTLYDDALSEVADLIHDATGIDVTGWKNDFGNLFDTSLSAPAQKAFPALRGERTGTDDAGRPVIDWYLNGEKVETYSDIFAFFGELLSPVQPVLDLVFCGKDFHVLSYTKGGVPSGSMITVKGNDGYNFAILPLLEAMGVSDALTPAQFKEMGTARALLKTVDLIVDRLFEIFDSPTLLSDLLEMLAQLMYAVSGNGTDVLLKNLLHPVWVLLDTLRPIVNIDLDAFANTMLCRYTYSFGKYTGEKEMLRVMNARGAAFSLKNLTVQSLLDVISVVVSIETDGTRKFLTLKAPYQAALNDLACLREAYESKTYVLDENGLPTARTAYRLNLNGSDALTVMLSMGIEILTYAGNADVLDAVIESLFGQRGLAKTAIELMRGLPAEYTSDFDWAYILGEDATAEDKAALLAQIKENGFVLAADHRTAQAQKDYDRYLASYDLTDWDEDTAVYLVENLDAMLQNALNAKIGDKTLGATLLEKLDVESSADTFTVGSFVMTLVDGLLTDDTFDKLIGALGDFLNGRDNPLFESLSKLINKQHPEDALATLHTISAKLAQYNTSLCKVASAIGIDLQQYNVDSTKTVRENGVVTYYNFDGAPTGLTRPAMQPGLENLEDVLYALTKPVQPLLSFALLGNNLSLFNASGVNADKARRDDLIDVTGIETYRYVLLPLMEALGCEGLLPADDYGTEGTRDVDRFMQDLLTSAAKRIRALLSGGDSQKMLSGLLDLVPDLLYFLNSNALGVSLQNLTAQIVAILDDYNDYAGKTGDERLTLSGLIKQFTGLEPDLQHIKLTDLLNTINGLHLDAFKVRLLDNFTTGKIYYNAASVCDFDTYRMTYADSRDKAATTTILVSLLLDVLEDPANKDFFTKLLGENIYQTLQNVFDLNRFDFEYQDPSWLFTEYADTDHLVSALTLSKLFDLDPYAGKKWTREMAAELADNLEQFINDMLYLLGLEIGGIKIGNLRELMHALIGGLLFSNDTMNALTGLLGKIKPLLDQYDPDGAIAGFIKELIGVDLHAWDDYAPGGKYENGRDWGFSTESTEAAVDANGAVFEAALTELLAPVAPVLAWLLADSDFTLFAEGDGLGENAEPIQLTFPGAEGYRYALVPLFEALNIDGRPKDLVQNLRDGDICDPAEYTAKVKEDVSFAVTGIVHPLVMMLQKLMDSTATQLLDLLPSIVYFINSNGIDTVVKNLIHAVMIIGNAAEPMKKQISALVYDEQGLDLYRTLNVEKLIKENVYTLIGVTEEDVKDVYTQCGGTWTAVDGLEDFDFRLLFSIGLAAVNGLLAKNGIPLKFTSIAALAVNELTHGFVRSYDSLTGKTAYTMVLDKEIDRYCYGDLISILMRIILKFLSVDNNADALVALIKTKANIGGVGEAAICSFLHLLAGYMGTLGGFEVAMLSIYYTVYGASRASGSGVEAYDHVNDKLGQVVDHLTNLDNEIARAVLQALIGAADENIGDIIGSQGLAGNGLIRFFKQIIERLLQIFNVIKRILQR